MILANISLILLVASGLLLAAPSVNVAGEPVPMPRRMGPRTNLPAPFQATRTNQASTQRAPGRATSAPPSAVRSTVKTNAVAAKPAATGTNVSGLRSTFETWRSNPAFLPAVAGVALCLGALVLYRAFRSKKTAAVPAKALAARAKPQRAFRACNVLEVGTEARQVWQFDAHGGVFVLNRETTCLDGEALPGNVGRKDWRALFQPKVNIAWLPPEQVFLRVTHLPKSSYEETMSMVELQMERLSPMPVAQVVWSFHVLPHTDDNLQTLVVMIVARAVVEEFLGKLETQGYFADRIEFPLVDQLQTTAITEDGAWIYPEAAGGKNTALVAWWYGGVLRNLDFLMLPDANRAASLREQLLQMAWAGESEGWLAGTPQWHLVADVAAGEWEPALREGLEQPVDTIGPRPARELAALTARRAAHAVPGTGLMPPEYAGRYQQLFVDRLWMRGILTVAALYLAFVAVYMVRLGYASFRLSGVEARLAELGPTYTNAIQLRDRYKVLKDRQELKYAGLDCWSTTAKLLPEGVNLDSLNFTKGKVLSLNGTAQADQYQKLLDFERDMRKTTIDGQVLFDPERGDTIQWRAQGQNATWSLTLELKRSEVQ